ncbi:hypothetical protein CSC82_13755 [Rhodobacteraceae bacterium 4F10]|nr:hypothetical protein CSC82_13755 [Rhodobacteraceae bacterium 4F10]
MSTYTKALIALSAVTLLMYSSLVATGVWHLVLGPDHLPPFDLRVLGYTYFDARAYLSLLTPEQAALYVGTLRKMDTIFPLLMGLWIGMCLWGVTRNLHPWSRLILLIAPASFTVMDLCENALIAEMVRSGPDALERDLVALASAYTMSKYVTLFVAFGLLLVMIVRTVGATGGKTKP